MKRICDSGLLEGTRSVRFELQPVPGRLGPVLVEGFALRDASGAVRGYQNVCAHRGQPVDVGDGRLFAGDGTLECQAHGAHFDAATGRCLRGPCEGSSLRALPLEEHGGAVWLREEPEAAEDE